MFNAMMVAGGAFPTRCGRWATFCAIARQIGKKCRFFMAVLRETGTKIEPTGNFGAVWHMRQQQTGGYG
ncbi:MAG: hypothetical protein H6891_11445 [Brucellaceae bacterium]|nr:hypothetical protein [Brucellaceae bacterium]